MSRVVSVLIEVPDMVNANIESLDEQLRAVADRTPTVDYDGGGSDSTNYDFFLWADTVDPLVTGLTRIAWPPGTIVRVTVRNSKDCSTRRFDMALAGELKGACTNYRVTHSRLAPGDWFLLPLDDDLVLARIAHLGHFRMLMYVFGGRRASAPSFEELSSLSTSGPTDAIAHVLYEPSPLENGSWTWLGPETVFEPDEWPLPEFEDVFSPTAQHFARWYPDGLDGDFESRELPESEWWQRSPNSVWNRSDLDGILRRALDDPHNRYVMPARDDWPPT